MKILSPRFRDEFSEKYRADIGENYLTDRFAPLRDHARFLAIPSVSAILRRAVQLVATVRVGGIERHPSHERTLDPKVFHPLTPA